MLLTPGRRCPMAWTFVPPLASATNARRPASRSPRPRRRRPHGGHRDRGRGGGGGLSRGPAPLPVPRLLGGVHRAPRLPAGGRASLPRLADPGTLRPAVRAAIRGG